VLPAVPVDQAVRNGHSAACRCVWQQSRRAADQAEHILPAFKAHLLGCIPGCAPPFAQTKSTGRLSSNGGASGLNVVNGHFCASDSGASAHSCGSLRSTHAI